METSMEIYNVRLALYTRQCEQRCGKSCVVWKGVESRASRISNKNLLYP